MYCRNNAKSSIEVYSLNSDSPIWAHALNGAFRISDNNKILGILIDCCTVAIFDTKQFGQIYSITGTDSIHDFHVGNILIIQFPKHFELINIQSKKTIKVPYGNDSLTRMY